MSLLRFAALTRYFGAEKLFGPLSASVEAGDAIGLIGRNGAGKTTLLRIIAGVDVPDAGEVQRSRGLQTGYMVQDNRVSHGITLWGYAASAFEQVKALEQRMRILEHAIASSVDQDEQSELMSEYALVQTRFDIIGGYSTDAAVKSTLFGLGFAENQFEQEYALLSGGQKSRAALARLLLTAPDLLLLDEPTNHLDVDAIEWLEGYLRSYKGACIIVAHDRTFLDAVTRRIWEIEEGGLETYPGNYSASRAIRLERRERQLAEYEAQQEEIHTMEAYVRRYKAGNRSTMAKGREKALARLERIRRPLADNSAMHLHLAAGPRSGKEVVLLDNVSVAFTNISVVSNLDLLLCRGDRVGVTGPNGAGKSTLIKVIAGLVPPSSGHVRYGKDVVIGYFSQELNDLSDENTLIDEVLTAQHMTIPMVRKHLARFLFTGDDVYKSVGVLSGGERNRLALAKLVLGEYNLLLLDEPTNHLDIPGREALEEALSTFAGTLVVVSHDRYFLDRLANRIWHVADKTVAAYDGNFSSYRTSLTQHTVAAPAVVDKAKSGVRRRSDEAERAAERAAARAARQVAAAVLQLEQEINASEAEKTRLEQIMADKALYADGAAAKEAVAAHRANEKRLESLYKEWEIAASQLTTEP